MKRKQAVGYHPLCGRCRRLLVRASSVNRVGKYGDVRINATRLPVRQCAAGCPGLYWGDANLAARLYEALTGGADFVLPRRMFGRRCPRCQERLGTASRPGRLRAIIPHDESPATVLEVEAPVLDCASCRASYLDAVGQEDGIRLALLDLLEKIVPALVEPAAPGHAADG